MVPGKFFRMRYTLIINYKHSINRKIILQRKIEFGTEFHALVKSYVIETSLDILHELFSLFVEKPQTIDSCEMCTN